MNVKWICFFMVLAGLPIFLCNGAPAYYDSTSQANRFNASSNGRSPAPVEDLQTTIRHLSHSVSDVKHELHNQEMEIRTFDANLHNQETILETLRQELAQSLQEQASSNKAQNIHLESKLESLDHLVKGLIADMKMIKGQANESVVVLEQYKQKLIELEKIIEAQNQHTQTLEEALKSIMEFLQTKEACDKSITKMQNSPKTYKVQPGDTLEKIARTHKVSVQTLREYNGLNHDRIMVGQILKIP